MTHLNLTRYHNIIYHDPSPEVDKVPEPANLVRRKYLVISGSAENIYRREDYEFIIVDSQHIEIRKPVYNAKNDNNWLKFDTFLSD